MAHKLTYALVVIALFSSACSMRSKNTVRLGPGTQLKLSQRGPGPGLAVTQQVRIEAKGKTFQFLSHGEIEASRMTLVGLTPLGTRAFSLSWDGQQLDFERLPFYRLPLKPKQLLAAYQMTFWPEDQLREHLGPGTQIRLVQNTNGRIFSNQNTVIAKVEFNGEDPFSGKAICHLLKYGMVIKFDTRHKEILK